MEPVNVFGGTGFIGSRFVELNPYSIINVREDYEVKTNNVLYLISTVDNYSVFTNPYLDIDTNLTTFIKVLETCKDKDIIFNFVSSWYVYGDAPPPIREDAYCNPIGFYGITKRAAEQMLIHYCETFGIKYRILRLSNVLGVGDKKVSSRKNVFQYMINQLKNNEDVYIFNEKISRDYLHVDDVIYAIDMIMDLGYVNEIYNIGRGSPTKLIDAVCYAKACLESRSDIIIGSDDTAIEESYFDVTKLNELGFNPRFSMTDIIKELVEN